MKKKERNRVGHEKIIGNKDDRSKMGESKTEEINKRRKL